MSAAPSETALAERFRSRDFVNDYPWYIAFVLALFRRAGHPRGGTQFQAESILADATIRCLSGTRRWEPDQDFRTFFFGVLRSVVEHALRGQRRERRRRDDDPAAVDEAPAPSWRWTEARDVRRRLWEAQEVLSGDPRTKSMLEAIEDGAEKPSDLVEKLGWSPEKAKAVRLLASRRLDAAGLRSKGQEESGARPVRKKVCP